MKIFNTAAEIFNKNFFKSNKSPVSPLTEGKFLYTPGGEAEYFTAGFGKAVMLPDDIYTKKYYIAGGSSGNPAKGVISPQYAHALWLDDNSGKGGHLFISLDIIGLLNNDVNNIRHALEGFAKKTGCRSITVMSTHNHAGIDTIGLWGPLPMTGKSKKFMSLLFSAALKAADGAYNDRRKGRLYLGRIEVPDFQERELQSVFSRQLTRLRFVPEDGTREIYFINFAYHSDAVQGSGGFISADISYYMSDKIKNKTGAETVYGTGAIGGIISNSAENKKKPTSERPISGETEKTGQRLAEYALSIKNETLLKPAISFIRQEFYCPVNNTVLSAAFQFNTVNADIYCSAYEKQRLVKSEMSYYEIDSLKILMLPCELFPELAYGGYLSEKDSAPELPESINPQPLTELAKDKNLLIFGFVNGCIGCVIPPDDFLTDEKLPYINAASDRFGRLHYSEINSLGPKTAQIIADIFSGIMKKANEAKSKNKG